MRRDHHWADRMGRCSG